MEFCRAKQPRLGGVFAGIRSIFLKIFTLFLPDLTGQRVYDPSQRTVITAEPLNSPTDSYVSYKRIAQTNVFELQRRDADDSHVSAIFGRENAEKTWIFKNSRKKRACRENRVRNNDDNTSLFGAAHRLAFAKRASAITQLRATLKIKT